MNTTNPTTWPRFSNGDEFEGACHECSASTRLRVMHVAAFANGQPVLTVRCPADHVDVVSASTPHD